MKKISKNLVRYIRRTMMNKLCAIGLLGLGWLSMTVSKDATFLVFTMLFAIPLFFSRKNYFMGES